MTRNHWAKFRCSEDEFNFLRAKATKAKFATLAAWLRSLTGIDPVSIGAPLHGEDPKPQTIRARRHRAKKNQERHQKDVDK